MEQDNEPEPDPDASMDEGGVARATWLKFIENFSFRLDSISVGSLFSDEYEVEGLRMCRKLPGGVEYLVKWKGYKQLNWEVSSIFCIVQHSIFKSPSFHHILSFLSSSRVQILSSKRRFLPLGKS
jgi:hypothetical protein